jgi:hypothetical protein
MSSNNLTLGPPEGLLPTDIQGWVGSADSEFVVSTNLSDSISCSIGVESATSSPATTQVSCISVVVEATQGSNGIPGFGGMASVGGQFWGLLKAQTFNTGRAIGVLGGAGLTSGTGNPEVLTSFLSWPSFNNSTGVPLKSTSFYARALGVLGSFASAAFYAEPQGANVSGFQSDQGPTGYAFNATDSTSISKFGKIRATGLSVHANNAAALAGGLVVNDFYRTGSDPDTVCVVH